MRKTNQKSKSIPLLKIEKIRMKDIRGIYPFGIDAVWISYEMEKNVLKLLAKSIDEVGLLDAIHLVEVDGPKGFGLYIIQGSNRWKAAKLTKTYKSYIPAIIHRDLKDDKRIKKFAVDSNLYRKNIGFQGEISDRRGKYKITSFLRVNDAEEMGLKIDKGRGRRKRGEITLEQCARKLGVSSRTLRSDIRLWQAHVVNPDYVKNLIEQFGLTGAKKIVLARSKDRDLILTFGREFKQDAMKKIMPWLLECVSNAGMPRRMTVNISMEPLPLSQQLDEKDKMAYLRARDRKAKEIRKKWEKEEGPIPWELTTDLRRGKEEIREELISWIDNLLEDYAQKLQNWWDKKDLVAKVDMSPIVKGTLIKSDVAIKAQIYHQKD